MPRVLLVVLSLSLLCCVFCARYDGYIADLYCIRQVYNGSATPPYSTPLVYSTAGVPNPNANLYAPTSPYPSSSGSKIAGFGLATDNSDLSLAPNTHTVGCLLAPPCSDATSPFYLMTGSGSTWTVSYKMDANGKSYALTYLNSLPSSQTYPSQITIEASLSGTAPQLATVTCLKVYDGNSCTGSGYVKASSGHSVSASMFFGALILAVFAMF